MSTVALEAIWVLAMPIIIFMGGGWIMSRLTDRQYVADRLSLNAAPDDRKPLNIRKSGYDLSAVNRHWGTLDDTARRYELHFLYADLVFPVVYGAALAASLLMAWEKLGRSFHPGWIIMPVVLGMVADWTENFIQIGQLRRYKEKDESKLDADLIQIASAATRLKLLSLASSYVLLIILMVIVITRALQSM